MYPTQAPLALAITGVGGAVILGLLLAIRGQIQAEADKKRRTYLVTLPSTTSHDELLSFVRALFGLPHPKFLQPVYAISLEAVGDADGETFYLSIPGHVHHQVEKWLTEHLPGSGIVPVETDVVAATKWERVTELRLTSSTLPLQLHKADGVMRSIRSSYRGLYGDQKLLMQWLVFPARPMSVIPEGKPDAHDKAMHKAKLGDATYNAVCRIAASGPAAGQIAHNLYASLSMTRSYRVRWRKRFTVRDLAPMVQKRRGRLVYPITLNAEELTAVMAWPFGGAGKTPHIARPLEPSRMIPKQGIVLAKSNYHSAGERPLALTNTALSMHTWVQGPSGTGKSVLLHNLCQQFIEQGYGLTLLDPKADLCRDVVNSIPKKRLGDIIWLDPTDTDFPIGLNVLAGPDPERTTANVVQLFKSLFSDSWGSRLERIMRYTVLTAAVSGLTLYDCKQLLLNPDFRGRVVRRIKDGDTRQFWRWLDTTGDTVVDSVVNKLDAFMASRAIRNIVAQQHGLDLEAVIRQRKILLVPLDGVRLGQANAAMLGSLLIDAFWKQIRLRPVEERIPHPFVMDEWQNYMQASTSMEDMFVLARSYQMPLIVANQQSSQLDKKQGLLPAVKANAATKVFFRMPPEDAKHFTADFPPMSADDLTGLPLHTVAVRAMTDSGLAPTATGTTAPPPEPTGLGDRARELSRNRFGRPVAEVEAELAERHKTNEAERVRPTVGREQ